MDTLITVDHARRVILDAARVVSAESVRLQHAVGRTLAGPVIGGPLPPFDTSAMDGLAVRLGDLETLPARLPIAATVHAGDALPGPLPAQSVVAVMTGAPVPPGTEAIVPVEWGRREAGDAIIERAPARGQFLRPAGGALPAGATVQDAGAVITPAAVGLLAAVGAATVDVRRQPAVAVISTGDELVGLDETPGPGQIRDANGPALCAQVEAAGGKARALLARDDAPSIARALDAASDADLIVVAGGVSMGERDLVRPELERRGVAWSFWTVRQRPGKPLAFGHLGETPVIGLPGNPVSAAVCFEVYVRPLLAGCLDRREQDREVWGRLLAPIPKAEGLHTFARVAAERDANEILGLRPAEDQASHVALSLVASDGLAHLPAEWSEAPTGARVRFQPWSWR